MTKNKNHIPEFKNREELAEFWDTHDITDYLHEMKPVRVKFSKNLSTGITVRFDKKTLRNIRKKAHAKGIGATTLIRMWVLERLKNVPSERVRT